MNRRNLTVIQAEALIADLDALMAKCAELGGQPATIGRMAAMRSLPYAAALQGEIASLEAGNPPTVYCRSACYDFHPVGIGDCSK